MTSLCVIIPLHNEAQHLSKVLATFARQQHIPDLLIIVNDQSTDDSLRIAQQFAAKHDWVQVVDHKSANHRMPGAKVVRAFNAGLATTDLNTFNLIGKFDADILLPPEYFKTLVKAFNQNPTLGIASGLLYVQKNQNWEYERISKKTKVRGPVKLYRTSCFKQLDGLRESIGWDTADVLLAAYYKWKVKTFAHLKVKHLRPTGQGYSKTNAKKQGQTCYALRYGLIISVIAITKLAWQRKSARFFMGALLGYLGAQNSGVKKIVNKQQGIFIRKLRFQGMLRKHQ